MKIERYGSKYWAVYDHLNKLICVTVYKKGAYEVARRLSLLRERAENICLKC